MFPHTAVGGVNGSCPIISFCSRIAVETARCRLNAGNAGISGGKSRLKFLRHEWQQWAEYNHQWQFSFKPPHLPKNKQAFG